jgi:hypothetical protein
MRDDSTSNHFADSRVKMVPLDGMPFWLMLAPEYGISSLHMAHLQDDVIGADAV